MSRDKYLFKVYNNKKVHSVHALIFCYKVLACSFEITVPTNIENLAHFPCSHYVAFVEDGNNQLNCCFCTGSETDDFRHQCRKGRQINGLFPGSGTDDLRHQWRNGRQINCCILTGSETDALHLQWRAGRLPANQSSLRPSHLLL